MGVRKTESRLPSGLQANDLGEAINSADGKLSLVSFFTAPLSPALTNNYVLFVHDTSLVALVHSFRWHVMEDGSMPYSQTTDTGELMYQTTNIGNLIVSVTLLDNSSSPIAKISMVQQIHQLEPTLETQIQQTTENEGPGAANIEASRELINGYRNYYKNLQLQIPETDDSFMRFIGGIIFRTSLKNPYAKQKENFDLLAQTLGDNTDAFPIHAARGIGPCDIRLALLAMNYPLSTPLLPWTELPEPPDENNFADEQLRQKLNEISEEDKADLLNLSRFPKTSINLCAKIIENLRNKYFGGASFNDVLTGMSGTRGHWILKHYLKGPLLKS